MEPAAVAHTEEKGEKAPERGEEAQEKEVVGAVAVKIFPGGARSAEAPQTNQATTKTRRQGQRCRA